MGGIIRVIKNINNIFNMSSPFVLFARPKSIKLILDPHPLANGSCE